MKYQVIPLYNFPNNTYSIVVEVDGKNVTFNLFFSYNNQAQYWTLDILDQNKNPIICKIPLLSGFNLLQGYEYLNIGELYLLMNAEDNNEIPDSITLGSDYTLVWGG